MEKRVNENMLSVKKIQKLKPSKTFAPYPVDPDDEIYMNGYFRFNITKMYEYIQQHPDQFSIENVLITDLESFTANINEAHLPSVIFEQPIILAEIAPQKYNVIDGNHRVEKARRSGHTQIRAYRIPAHLHCGFLLTKEMYLSYIQYWNGKLKDQ